VKRTRKTPKSAPPAKRKKLSEEIDDQISDEEFEVSSFDIHVCLCV
jgi:hypothetical protein